MGELIFVRLIFSRLTRPVPDVRIKINSFTGGNMFINEQSLISLNGMPQYVSIRAQKKDAPLLLYLHGGPGDAALPLVMKFNRGLEENFTVVVWEQRGAGKSYYRLRTARSPWKPFFRISSRLLPFCWNDSVRTACILWAIHGAAFWTYLHRAAS